MPEGDGTGPLVPCSIDNDCFDGNLCTTRACQAGYCKTVSSTVCNDSDICTSDACEPATGQCVFTSRVADNDGDGFFGALPGTVPGAADSCGDDCNDSNANVHPGATETCDGSDNNCNGVTDEGVDSYNPFTSAIRISDSTFTVGAPSGIAYDGNRFGISWTGEQGAGGFQAYFSGFNVFGISEVPQNDVSQTSNNAYGGPIVWTGSNYATAWEVRGDKGYDIFFNLLDVNGKKIGPDIRITNNRGFSMEPEVYWNGVDYGVLWADDNGDDLFRIYSQKISNSAELGTVHVLTPAIVDARSPKVVRGSTATLLVYLSGSSQRLLGQLINDQLTTVGSAFYLSETGAYDFSADWVSDRFVVAWSTHDAAPGNAIWATSVDASGNVIATPMRITSGASFAMSPSLLSLGNRFALAWADDRVAYNHFGIRLRTFDTNLSPLGAVTSLVEGPYDSYYPGLAAGGSGLALVYRNRTSNKAGEAYFLPLACSGALGF